MIQAIVFDMDDTLYQEKDYLLSGLKYVDIWVKENCHRTGFYEEAYQLFVSGENKFIFNRALELLEVNYDQNMIMEMLNVYRSHKPDIQLLEDAEWVLNNLYDNVKIGLISDGYLSSQKRKVNALKLPSRFNSIILSDEFGRENWKPSHIPYEKVASELKCYPNECVYVGDNLQKDFITAKKLGWLTVHIQRNSGIYPNTKLSSDYEAHFQIENLKELSNIPELQQLFTKNKRQRRIT
ncbi:HAD family hydrolase [Oceanobacillus chungangensis]|uniref:HAD family hydrolase n=1 Tax=Oceanobacillus chungangensis TaxID=1229152 RepID=A0A3D8PYP4_9BACI|nr:HAD family hydrolase [Oceanobacillus chungangensis]RDW20408.1 HAD family hydrolase [Oceanobacillus chungangensis]